MLLAIPIGIYSATHQYRFSDQIFTFLGFIGLTTPNFLLALMFFMLSMHPFGISPGGLFSPQSVILQISNTVAIMYLGKIVELAAVEDLFQSPLHPYTEALLSALPQPDPLYVSRTIVLEGSVPSPINPPSGCRFHPRCRYAKEIRCQEEPELRELEGTRSPAIPPRNSTCPGASTPTSWGARSCYDRASRQAGSRRKNSRACSASPYENASPYG